MMFPQHMLGGAAAWLAVATVIDMAPLPLLLGLPVAIVASTYPDIDHGNTWIVGRLNKLLPGLGSLTHRIVDALFGGHRRGAHSLVLGVPLFTLLAALPLWWPLGLWAWFLPAATLVGSASHVGLDCCTGRKGDFNRAGCEIFWPISRERFGIPLLVTKSRREYRVARPLLMLAVAAGVVGSVLT